MAASAPRVRPSPESLAFAGRVWNGALARQQEALAWMGARYPVHQTENFAALRWDDLGGALQEEIACELAEFLKLCRKVGFK